MEKEEAPPRADEVLQLSWGKGTASTTQEPRVSISYTGDI